MNNNYPGGYSQRPYGYSGQGAYRPSGGMGMGTKMAMMGGGGLLLGMGGMYMFSRWNSYDRCTSDSWQGSCQDCHRSGQSRCAPSELRENANRDDLMKTGFWPDDWTGPLTVKITSILGADFAASLICPPPVGSEGWNISAGQDIFLTLTKVAELGDELARDTEKSDGSMLESLVGLLFLCCICGGIAMCVGFFMKSMRGQQQQQYDQGQGYDQYGNPAYGQPQGYDQYGNPMQQQPQYGQPQYGQPQYGQPQYGQPQYGQQYAAPYGQPQYAQPYQGGPQYGGQPPVMMGQPVGGGIPMGTVVAVHQPAGGGYQQGMPPGGYQPGLPPQA